MHHPPRPPASQTCQSQCSASTHQRSTHPAQLVQGQGCHRIPLLVPSCHPPTRRQAARPSSSLGTHTQIPCTPSTVGHTVQTAVSSVIARLSCMHISYALCCARSSSNNTNFLVMEIGGYVHFNLALDPGLAGYEGARAIGPTRKGLCVPRPRRPDCPDDPRTQIHIANGRSCSHAHTKPVSCLLPSTTSAHASADADSSPSSAQPVPVSCSPLRQ